MENRSKVLLVLLLLLVTAIIVSALFLFVVSDKSGTQFSELKEAQPSLVDRLPNGFVYFSDDEEGTRRSVLKVYDVRNGTTDMLTTNPLAYDQYPIVIIDPEKNAPALLFVHTEYDPASDTLYPYSQYRQVVKRNLENGEETQISHSRIGNRVGLVWSQAAERFAFIGLAPEVLARRDTGEVTNKDLTRLDYSIYISDLEGNEKEIFRGTSPSWSADGKRLYFLGVDGVYQYDLDTANIDTVLQNKNWEFTFFMGLLVTEDENYIVWTDPLSRLVHVWEKQGTDEDRYNYTNSFLAPNDRIPVTAPVSVDETIIMYLAVEDDSDAGVITLLDIQTGEQTELLTFDTEEHYSYYAYPSWSLAAPK